MFKNWDWEDTALAILSAAVVLILVGGGVIFFPPKNVDYYYLSTAGSQHSTVCVDAHWTWHTDEVAFCSDDKDKALDFVTKANASFKH